MKFSLEHYLQGEALTPFVALNFELGLLDSHRKVHFIPLKCKNFFKLYDLNILFCYIHKIFMKHRIKVILFIVYYLLDFSWMYLKLKGRKYARNVRRFKLN